MDPETARRNNVLGIVLFALAVVIAGVTIAVAYAYNA